MNAVREFPQKMSARIDALEFAASICDWHAKEAEKEAKSWKRAKCDFMSAANKRAAMALREAAADIREMKGAIYEAAG